jgi:putative hydrolase of HD superfamily
MRKSRFAEFLSRERNLGKIIRFSARTRLKDESVAEHTFHAALYAMILADIEKQLGKKVDSEKILRAALLHDLEECMTGDILYDFKHSNKKLANGITKMGIKFYEALMKNLPKNLSTKYIEIRRHGKDLNTIEGKIVEAADKFEALIYAVEEYSLGNKSFKPIAKRLIKTLKRLKLKSVDMLLKQMKI